jgi:integrase
MNDMPRPRPPYLLRQVTQHGRVCWYVRRGKGKRIRVPAPGTEGFDQAYQTALAHGVTSAAKVRSNATGTLEWLVTRYRETTAWTSLSLATRRQRENILKHVLETAANQPVSRITKASIVAGKDRRPGHQGRHFLDTMRGIFKWAADAGLVKEDPTDRVKVVKPKIKGFPPWDEQDVAAYRNRWPIGTRQRVWLEVLVGTGLRRGDAGGYDPDIGGACGDTIDRPDRRSSLHLQRPREALHEGELRQRFHRSLLQSRHQKVSARGPQVQSHHCGIQGRHRAGA